MALAVFAVAVLGAGSWWWVASAPAPRVDGAGEVADAELASPHYAPDAVFQGDGPPIASIDPSTGRVVGGGVDALLPMAPDAVWREIVVVSELRSIGWQVPVRAGGAYILQYACLGFGELVIQIEGTLDGPVNLQLDCEQALLNIDLVSAARAIGVTLKNQAAHSMTVELQLIMRT